MDQIINMRFCRWFLAGHVTYEGSTMPQEPWREVLNIPDSTIENRILPAMC